MGLTSVEAIVANPIRRTRKSRVKLLVDSGALYSVLPERVWKALGLKAERQVEFDLADATSISRMVGEARFVIHGVGAVSPVVLGAKNDEPLLGAVTLESLGYMLNPLTRQLLPMRMMLARVGSAEAALRLAMLGGSSPNARMPKRRPGRYIS